MCKESLSISEYVTQSAKTKSWDHSYNYVVIFCANWFFFVISVLHFMIANIFCLLNYNLTAKSLCYSLLVGNTKYLSRQLVTISIVMFIKNCLIEAYSPNFCTKGLIWDLNNDLKVRVQVQFQSLNLDWGYTQQDIPSTTQR